MSNDNALMRQLKRAYEAGPLSQREIAESANVSAGTVKKCLNGKGNPTVRTYCRIAKALGVTSVRLDE